MLIEDFLASCAARNLSQESTKLYRIALTRFHSFAGSDMGVIDERLLRRYIFEMQSAGLSPTSVHHYFRVVKILLAYALEAGAVASNPAALLPMPRKGKRLPKALSENQAQALLDACPDWTWNGRRDKAAIFLLLGTGLRLSELLSLNIHDLNLEDGCLHTIGKGDKERTVPMDDDVVEVMKDWLGLRMNVLGSKAQRSLFISRSCGRMGKTFGQAVKQAGAQAGFHCTPHVCRHTFSTEWIRSGGDVMVLSQILGHSSISTTNIYIHLAQKDFREAANRCSITKRLRFDSRQMQFDTGR
jgi:integrase/recombinase XerD